MSITPRGMSIQEAYRLYREDKFLVNRKYQRKLVWTDGEKGRLIDSILKGYPIPLILLAEQSQVHTGIYEIIDGMQRLNAIFGFIENHFALDNKYFNISEFTRAKQVAELGLFTPVSQEANFLTQGDCANLLDYQLAITIYPATEEQQITDVFNRINSSGKQLSPQEQRQAGLTTPFSELIRKLAAELRGDASNEILKLSDMPAISIGSNKINSSYGLKAEDIFWCKQGILAVTDLRDSEDEDMIADIVASVLLDKPFPRSKEKLDELYAIDSSLFKDIEHHLAIYGSQKLAEEIKLTFSVLRETIEECSSEKNFLRKTVSPSNNPIKTSFYAIFMAFFDLLVKKEQKPANSASILQALSNLQPKLTRGSHHVTEEERLKNINITMGLIQNYFVRQEPHTLRHGPALALELQNSLNRSRIESSRYELKQGLLDLDSKRSFNNDLLQRLIKTICAIANLGPKSEGRIFIGVAEDKNMAEQIERLDDIRSINVGSTYVVGIDREVKIQNITIEEYVGKIATQIRNSKLSDALKRGVLANIDTPLYKGFSVIQIRIPPQSQISFVGDKTYIRENTSTVEVSGPGIVDVVSLFK